MRKTAILLLAATLITGCKFEFDLPKQEKPVVNVFSGLPQEEIDETVASLCLIAFGEGFLFGKRHTTKAEFNEKMAEIEKQAKEAIRKRSASFRQKNDLPPLPEDLSL